MSRRTRESISLAMPKKPTAEAFYWLTLAS